MNTQTHQTRPCLHRMNNDFAIPTGDDVAVGDLLNPDDVAQADDNITQHETGRWRILEARHATRTEGDEVKSGVYVEAEWYSTPTKYCATGYWSDFFPTLAAASAALSREG